MEMKTEVLVEQMPKCERVGTLWIEDQLFEKVGDKIKSMKAISSIYKFNTPNCYSFFIDPRYSFEDVTNEILKIVDFETSKNLEDSIPVESYISAIVRYIESHALNYHTRRVLDDHIITLYVVSEKTGEIQSRSWSNDLRIPYGSYVELKIQASREARDILDKFSNTELSVEDKCALFVREISSSFRTDRGFNFDSNYVNHHDGFDGAWIRCVVSIGKIKAFRYFRADTIKEFNGHFLTVIAKYEAMDILNEIQKIFELDIA